MLQDGRGDVVGKIADHARRAGKGMIGIAGHVRPPQQALEVDIQHVAFEDLDAGLVGVLHAQLRAQHTVEFDSDHMLGAPYQQSGQHAASGTDLDHRALRHVSQSIDDAPGGAAVGEEILSQLGPPVSLGRGSCHPHLLLH